MGCTNLGGGGNRGYASALKAAEDKIYKNSTESAILLDDKGKVIFSKSDNNKSQVTFTPEQIAKMKGANLTHNHPRNTTFSDADVGMIAIHGLNSVRATGTERTYELSAIKGFKQRKEIYRDYQTAIKENKKVTDRLYKGYVKDYNSGKISGSEFSKKVDGLNKKSNDFRSNWLKNNAEKYGYRYSVTERR